MTSVSVKHAVFSTSPKSPSSTVVSVIYPGGIMATITRGNSVNPAHPNARQRRHERRKAQAIQRELLESRIYHALGLKLAHRPALSRAEIASQRESHRVDVIVLCAGKRQPPQPSWNNCCLARWALYRVL
uniref:transcriptional antitermination N peptide n=1 Tax=Edwardsiella tarda TaxID=636 RepID=UPI00402AC05E